MKQAIYFNDFSNCKKKKLIPDYSASIKKRAFYIRNNQRSL